MERISIDHTRCLTTRTSNTAECEEARQPNAEILHTVPNTQDGEVARQPNAETLSTVPSTQEWKEAKQTNVETVPTILSNQNREEARQPNVETLPTIPNTQEWEDVEHGILVLLPPAQWWRLCELSSRWRCRLASNPGYKLLEELVDAWGPLRSRGAEIDFACAFASLLWPPHGRSGRGEALRLFLLRFAAPGFATPGFVAYVAREVLRHAAVAWDLASCSAILDVFIPARIVMMKSPMFPLGPESHSTAAGAVAAARVLGPDDIANALREAREWDGHFAEPVSAQRRLEVNEVLCQAQHAIAAAEGRSPARKASSSDTSTESQTDTHDEEAEPEIAGEKSPRSPGLAAGRVGTSFSGPGLGPSTAVPPVPSFTLPERSPGEDDILFTPPSAVTALAAAALAAGLRVESSC